MPPIAICIPVRDEARNIAGLFAALAAQRGAPDVAVAIAFDGCRDDSDAIARHHAAAHGLALHAAALPRMDRADAGRARGAVLALGRTVARARGMLLTTDADTRPAVDWVASTVTALRAADVVCGRIERHRRPADRWRDPIEAYLDRLHLVQRTIDPVAGDASPSHWHQGGASIALTSEAWDRLACLALPPSGEDQAIVRAARLAGLVVRQDPAVRVRTSARLRGRADGGLADALRTGRADAAIGREPMMEHPDDVIARLRRSASARAAFPVVDAVRLGASIGVAAASIREAARLATSADAFVTALPLTPPHHRAVTLADASRLLRRHEAATDERAA